MQSRAIAIGACPPSWARQIRRRHGFLIAARYSRRRRKDRRQGILHWIFQDFGGRRETKSVAALQLSPRCDETPHTVRDPRPLIAVTVETRRALSRVQTHRSFSAACPLCRPLLLLAGCNMVVMAPSGDIAVQQRDLILVSTVLMLLIIVPVIVLTLFFAWRYRQSNTERDTTSRTGTTRPSSKLVIWAAPLLIIIALGALTWISTHTLDPYRPLRAHRRHRADLRGRQAAGRRSRRARLEMAVHLSRAGHRHRQRTGGAGGPADRLQDHGILGDELVLHPGAGRPDLRDAGHGDQAARGDQQAGRVRGLLGQLQRRRLLATCASSSTA